jgi:hypothetical protein
VGDDRRPVDRARRRQGRCRRTPGRAPRAHDSHRRTTPRQSERRPGAPAPSVLTARRARHQRRRRCRPAGGRGRGGRRAGPADDTALDARRSTPPMPATHCGISPASSAPIPNSVRPSIAASTARSRTSTPRASNAPGRTSRTSSDRAAPTSGTYGPRDGRRIRSWPAPPGSASGCSPTTSRPKCARNPSRSSGTGYSRRRGNDWPTTPKRSAFSTRVWSRGG